MSPGLFKSDAQSPPASDRTSPHSTPQTSERPEKQPRRKDRGDPGVISVFAAGLVVEGEIRSDGDVRIEGRVNGNVSISGEVTVAARGVVVGDVNASSVVVAGRVDGTIKARESSRLVDGARVNADVESPRLALEDGAMLNGRVQMDKGSGRVEASERESKSGEASAREVA